MYCFQWTSPFTAVRSFLAAAGNDCADDDNDQQTTTGRKDDANDDERMTMTTTTTCNRYPFARGCVASNILAPLLHILSCKHKLLHGGMHCLCASVRQINELTGAAAFARIGSLHPNWHRHRRARA